MTVLQNFRNEMNVVSKKAPTTLNLTKALAKEKIAAILQAHFTVERLEVRDDSDRHRGHSEAQRHGGGHFSVIIVAREFEGKTSLQRHRMVHACLKKEIGTAIHALSIKALTPKEVRGD